MGEGSSRGVGGEGGFFLRTAPEGSPRLAPLSELSDGGGSPVPTLTRPVGFVPNPEVVTGTGPGSLLHGDVQQTITADPSLGPAFQSIYRSVDGLRPDLKRQILEAALSNNGASAKAVASVLGSLSWHLGDASQKAQLANLLTTCPGPALADLAMIAQDPNRLAAQDKQGKSLLTNLSELASQPLNGAFVKAGQTQQRLLGDVLHDLAAPEDVDQGNTQNCTVTSMQYRLLQGNPSEYARMMKELAGSSGSTALLGPGQLALQPDSLRPIDPGDQRSLSERIFQRSTMEFANGAEDFDPLTNRSTGAKRSRSWGAGAKRTPTAIPGSPPRNRSKRWRDCLAGPSGMRNRSIVPSR